MKNTKFWLAVGVEVALLGIFAALLATGHFDSGIFAVWLGAFIGVPVQYGITNVVASGQASESTTNVVNGG